jgi:thiol-disulfide isomerase/thioredoxin
MRALLAIALAGILLAPNTVAQAKPPQKPVELWLVNLTAEWCPNCRVLDPRLDQAFTRYTDGAVRRQTLDFTSEAASAGAFGQVNGTLLAGVYSDHLGVTGLGVLVAADTGEKLACVQRTMSVEAIIARIEAARRQLRAERPGLRTLDAASCPEPNPTERVGG